MKGHCSQREPCADGEHLRKGDDPLRLPGGSPGSGGKIVPCITKTSGLYSAGHSKSLGKDFKTRSISGRSFWLQHVGQLEGRLLNMSDARS